MCTTTYEEFIFLFFQPFTLDFTYELTSLIINSATQVIFFSSFPFVFFNNSAHMIDHRMACVQCKECRRAPLMSVYHEKIHILLLLWYKFTKPTKLFSHFSFYLSRKLIEFVILCIFFGDWSIKVCLPFVNKDCFDSSFIMWAITGVNITKIWNFNEFYRNYHNFINCLFCKIKWS